MLTGLYAHAHGVTNNFTELPAARPTLHQRLREAGWETAWIGKWHMGEDNDEKRAGFDRWISHKGQGTYFDTEFNVDGERRRVPGYYTHAVTRFALDYLRAPRSKPFFLAVSHKAPHSPNLPEERHARAFDAVDVRYPPTAGTIVGKPRWVEERQSTWHGIYGPLFGFRKTFPDASREGEKTFAGFVRAYWGTILSVDDSVGELLGALKASGELDRTIVVFTSDNGFFLGEHGMMDKRTMHEASIRVPLLVRFPPLAPAGRVVQEQVLNVDLAPSLLEAAGAPPLQGVHGRSWVPLLRGPAAGWRKSWLYEYDYEKQFPYTPNVRGVRTADWKFIRYPHGDGGPDRHLAELYNLKIDPLERTNLFESPIHQDMVRGMRAELDRLMAETGPGADRMPLDEGVKTTLPDPKIR
jgi:N-acetylglucosamine-6-sulfatase